MACGGKDSPLDLSIEQETPLDLSLERVPDLPQEPLFDFQKLPLKNLKELETLETFLNSNEHIFNSFKEILVENCFRGKDHTTDKDFFYMMLDFLFARNLKKPPNVLNYKSEKKGAVALNLLTSFKAIQEVYKEKKRSSLFEDIDRCTTNWFKKRGRETQPPP